ncbi:MAG: hypothetical protein ACP5NW_01835 [Candidatus Woesearchaeota archaeon]
MRCRYTFLNSVLFMFLILLFVLTFMPSVDAAVIYGGKLFHSENFTTMIGGTFKVYGTDSYKDRNNVTGVMETKYMGAVIMSNIDSTIRILNGTCESTLLYKYCYKGSTVDFDDERTFNGGDILSKMTITIESLPPPSTIVTFNRSNKMNAYCGELITIPILVKNAGGLPTNITYTEILSENTLITKTEGGIVEGNVITFKERMLANTSKNYSYTIINFDCADKHWNARYSFTTHNDTIWKNITNLSILMLDSYKINDSIYPTRVNYPTDEIVYNVTINNTHPSIALYLDISISAPDLAAKSASNGISTNGTNYRYSGWLYVGKGLTLSMVFIPTKYGASTITNNAKIKINDREMYYNSESELQMLYPNVTVYIDVNDTLNNSLLVSIYALNDDMKRKYYYIYGVLKGVIDGAEEPLYSNGIDPGARILVGSYRYNTTGMGIKEMKLSFSGVYRDVDSIEHPLYAERIVKINSPYYNVNIDPTLNTTKKVTQGSNSTALANTTKNQTSSSQKNSTITTAAETEKPKKDFITRIIEGLNRFLESLFG